MQYSTLFLLGLPVIALLSYEHHTEVKQLDELFFLTQEQGYCDAVVDYGQRRPPDCVNEVLMKRDQRLDELHSELGVQPSMPSADGHDESYLPALSNVREQRNELFLLLHEHGYCAAVAAHHLAPPNECSMEAGNYRTQRLEHLREYTKIQPVIPYHDDTTIGRLPKPVSVSVLKQSKFG